METQTEKKPLGKLSAEDKQIFVEFRTMVKGLHYSKFMKDVFTDDVCRCCGIGHWVRLRSKNRDNYDLKNCTDKVGLKGTSEIRRVSEIALWLLGEGDNVDISSVNNDDLLRYPQKTVKARLLAFCDEVIEKL